MTGRFQPYGQDPAHVGNEKYLAGFWIIEACNRKIEVRRNAAKAAGRTYGRRRCPAMASTSRIVLNGRTRKSLKDIREAVWDQGGGVRSRDERPPRRGAPDHRR
jgi:hypothetical protein